jgi:hypothetical protein
MTAGHRGDEERQPQAAAEQLDRGIDVGEVDLRGRVVDELDVLEPGAPGRERGGLDREPEVVGLPRADAFATFAGAQSVWSPRVGRKPRS